MPNAPPTPESRQGRIVVMGPSGCGKTTLARALALALDWRYVEGDELHPASNLAKMAAGQPLDDADRAPWLARVGAALAERPERGVVAACSALKRRYRDVLRDAAGPIRFVLPVLPRDALAQRLARRSGHYMPASLLDSQLADLEPPARDEEGLSVDGSASVLAQIGDIRSRLRL
jgi:carbohydrate kinase (thermoresistant glucokinase family)